MEINYTSSSLQYILHTPHNFFKKLYCRLRFYSFFYELKILLRFPNGAYVLLLNIIFIKEIWPLSLSQMLEISACLEELKDKSGKLIESADPEYTDISFEDFLAQEKKDSFWSVTNSYTTLY